MTPKTLTPAELANKLGLQPGAIRRACLAGKIPHEVVTHGAKSHYRIPDTAAVARKAMALPTKSTGRTRGAKDTPPLASFGPYRVVAVRPGVWKCVKRGKGAKTFCHGISPEIVVQSAPLPEDSRRGLMRQLAARKSV